MATNTTASRLIAMGVFKLFSICSSVINADLFLFLNYFS